MNIEKYKKDIKNLITLGAEMMEEFYGNEKNPSFPKFFNFYQGWYTESHALIQQLLPNRINEFESLYYRDTKRKIINNETYSIQDWFLGLRTDIKDPFSAIKKLDTSTVLFMKFQAQLQILEAVGKRFESSLFDIKHLVQADVFDNELDVAEELAKKGFTRAAGAVAGVVLEGHLKTVYDNHGIKISKKNPTISDFNDALKNADVLEFSDWRRIQLLGDIRNKCDHKKKVEPKKEEIEELIEGVKKIMKNIF